MPTKLMIRKDILMIIFNLTLANKEFFFEKPYFIIFIKYKKGINYCSIDFQSNNCIYILHSLFIYALHLFLIYILHSFLIYALHKSLIYILQSFFIHSHYPNLLLYITSLYLKKKNYSQLLCIQMSFLSLLSFY